MGKFTADFDGKVKVWSEGVQVFVGLDGGHLRKGVRVGVRLDSDTGAELSHHILLSRLTKYIAAIGHAARVSVDSTRLTFDYGYGKFLIVHSGGSLHIHTAGQPCDAHTAYLIAHQLRPMMKILGWDISSIAAMDPSLLSILVAIQSVDDVSIDETDGQYCLRLCEGDRSHRFLILNESRTKTYQFGVVMLHASATVVETIQDTKLLPGTTIFVALGQNDWMGSDAQFLASTPMAFTVRKEGRDAQVRTKDLTYEIVAHNVGDFVSTPGTPVPTDKRPASFVVRQGEKASDPGWTARSMNELVWTMVGEAMQLRKDFLISALDVAPTPNASVQALGMGGMGTVDSADRAAEVISALEGAGVADPAAVLAALRAVGVQV